MNKVLWEGQESRVSRLPCQLLLPVPRTSSLQPEHRILWKELKTHLAQLQAGIGCWVCSTPTLFQSTLLSTINTPPPLLHGLDFQAGKKCQGPSLIPLFLPCLFMNFAQNTKWPLLMQKLKICFYFMTFFDPLTVLVVDIVTPV